MLTNSSAKPAMMTTLGERELDQTIATFINVIVRLGKWQIVKSIVNYIIASVQKQYCVRGKKYIQNNNMSMP